MKDEKMTFESYVIKGILANNDFGIEEVSDLVSIKSMALNREQYPLIVTLINEGKIDEIKVLPFGIREFEYLEIMSFTDQHNKKYVVTVYSSDALESDPQIMDIFSLNN